MFLTSLGQSCCVSKGALLTKLLVCADWIAVRQVLPTLGVQTGGLCGCSLAQPFPCGRESHWLWGSYLDFIPLFCAAVSWCPALHPLSCYCFQVLALGHSTLTCS